MFTASLRTRLRGLRLFRPRTVAHLVKTGDESRRELRDLVRTVKLLQEQVAAMKAGHEQFLERLQTQQTESFESAERHRAVLADDLRALTQTLSEVNLREGQLRAIARANAELDASERELNGILQPSAVSSHVRSAIAAATLHDDPFPYAVVDNLLPDHCYDALIRGLPPVELFADRPINKQQLKVPLDLAPSYSHRVWAFMADVVAAEIIAPAIVEKFDVQATAWLRLNFPAVGDDPLRAIPLTCSDGRILLRRPGYYIPPHRDPKWGFLTCLLYLARPGDDERWGTDLHRVDEDEEAHGAKPHWIDEQRCHIVERVAFRRNRALIFLNSTGAHSSRIPPHAQPADLERYAYQFRIGAGSGSIHTLLAHLPPERRPLWEGKVAHNY